MHLNHLLSCDVLYRTTMRSSAGSHTVAQPIRPAIRNANGGIAIKAVLLAASLFAAIGLSADAGIVFSDDFESDTVGNEPAGWDSVSGTNNITVQSSSTAFGASNQYLNFNDVATGGLSLFKQTTDIDGVVSTFSFDFYEPDAAGDASISVGYATASGDINGSAAMRVSLDNGTITFSSGQVVAGTKTYSEDTAYRFYFIVNDSAVSTAYTSPGGGSETLAGGEFDLYFQELSSSTFTYAGTGSIDVGDSLGRLGFRTFSTGDQVVLLDNVEVVTGVVIPEPASLVLIGMGGAFLFPVRRHRESKVSRFQDSE